MVREGYEHGGSVSSNIIASFVRTTRGQEHLGICLTPLSLPLCPSRAAAPGTPVIIARCLTTVRISVPLLPWSNQPGLSHRVEQTAICKPYDTLCYKNFQDTPTTSPLPSSIGSPQQHFCISWNKDQCAFCGACTYGHTCPNCSNGCHGAKDCPKILADSSL